MDQLLEFFSNHPFLIACSLAVFSMLLWNLLQGTLQGVRGLLPTRVVELINHENAELIDVRGTEEYSRGHLPNASNVSLTQSQQYIDRTAAGTRPGWVVVYGPEREAIQLSKQLIASQYPNVAYLKGGVPAWTDAGLPLRKKS